MKHSDIKGLTSISKNNLENLFNVYDDGVYYYNLMRTVNIPAKLDPSVYFLLKINSSVSLTALSYRVYGNINLWWLICVANGIDDTVRPMTPGRVLKIIHPDKVQDIIRALTEST